MLNDRSSVLSLLATRRSGRPREMIGDGPSEAELEQILTVAARTPDHGKLSPWRFITVGSSQRDDLAQLFREAMAAEDAQALPAKLEKADEVARSGGALIVVVSSPISEHKIPLWEQELSCGAATMNLLHAAHAMGYVGGWVTGWQAYSPTVSAAFCGPGERIAGFIFIGQPGRELEERSRPALANVSRAWSGRRRD